jgi:hypothetical protein
VTSLTIEDDDDNNCFECLLVALRAGYAPKRIAVDAAIPAAADRLGQLALALRESRTLTGLSLSALVHQERTRHAFHSLVSAAAENASLKALEADYTPRSPAEWETIWSAAASHPTLSTLRVRYRTRIPATGRPSGFDLLQAVEAAVQANRRLVLIEIADDGQKYHQTKEYKDRILPLLRSNRVAALTSDIKRCTDEDPAAWGGRLFAVAVRRLCQSSSSNSKAAAGVSLSCLLNLFRGNPEQLERCTRVPDALRRLWMSRMGAVDALLGEALQIERRMAASGVEVPSAALTLPNVTVWRGKDAGAPDAKRPAGASGVGETASCPKRPKTI